MAQIYANDTLRKIRKVLEDADRLGVPGSEKALKLLDQSVLDQLTERNAAVCVEEGDEYVHDHELNYLQYLRQTFEHALDDAENFHLLQEHVPPQSYHRGVLSQITARRMKGERNFKIGE